MAPRNSKPITPSIAPVIKRVAEYSLHRLPKEETEENLMNILNAYIDSKGRNTQARSYLEQSDFIKNIAKRLHRPEESCTIENLDTILSYMEEN